MTPESNGILVVDKPPEITAARVVARIKGMLKVKKIGHTGTLDPFATGLMVCCLNQGTKLARFFLHGEKTYEGELVLGIRTDTQDATGRVTAADGDAAAAIGEEQIRAAFQRFVGEIDQTPPAFSALKHEGVPLYKLARKGTPVEKPPRRVRITSLEIDRIRPPTVGFRVTCSAGTYVRTLCADIGDALGCGGHLKALRRTAGGGFSVSEAATLPEIEALASGGRIRERIIPPAAALRGMAAHEAPPGLAGRILNGNAVTTADIPPPLGGEYVKVVDEAGGLLAVIQHKKGSCTYIYCCVFPK